MITEAHLHLRPNIKKEVRARTYQIHTVRCISRHRNREDRILPRKKIDRMKTTTRRRKIEIKIRNNHTHSKGKREKKFKSSKEAIESKKSRKDTHKRMRKHFADWRLARIARGVEEMSEQQKKTSIRTSPLRTPGKKKRD